MLWKPLSSVTGWILGPRSQEVDEEVEWHSVFTLEDLLAMCAHPVSTLLCPESQCCDVPPPPKGDTVLIKPLNCN